ncbi:hypothetical protein [Pseudomonas xantholysinigenes]|uniref:Peptidyl-Asp metalloendopeptidase n=1 Tax=Pseudomonas xantholysinigenes TaxID=2745490 RepID=A0A9E6PUX4_9PSED|nr:hypothetical protein [Pseudomonas xantholysinigenes]QXI37422.1 hypothetical protein HU772_019065 [Pseudomonas xantholysinigenes]
MIRSNKKNLTTVILLSIFFLLPSKLSAASPTGSSIALYEFEPAVSRNAIEQLPSTEKSPELTALLAEPTTKEISLVRVNLDAVKENNKILSITLPDRQEVPFVQDYFEITAEGTTVWAGAPPSDRRQRFPSPSEVKRDPLNMLFIQHYGDHVRGEIRLAGQAYRLEPAGAGLHALLKVDQGQTTCEPVTESDNLPATPAPTTNRAARSTITYLIVSTDEARKKNSLIEERIENSMKFAQRFLDNSDIDITFEKAGYYAATYSENGKTSNTVLRDLRDTSAEPGKSVLAERERVRADIVIVAAGLVDGTSYRDARKETAFALVKTNSVAEEIIHQVGHVLGADHIWKEGDPEFEPPYKFGYLMNFMGGTKGSNTLMGQYENCGGCGMASIFSNPRETYVGHPTGTVEHNDVARRFNERRTEVENFY